uniref:Putative ovule protein n=1 Tax=Solanum chacoense TaxID=4108 RepID=A0A0V0HLB8_SOLCH
MYNMVAPPLPLIASSRFLQLFQQREKYNTIMILLFMYQFSREGDDRTFIQKIFNWVCIGKITLTGKMKGKNKSGIQIKIKTGEDSIIMK